MRPGQELLFPPFRLDPANQRLWLGPVEVPIRAKTFAVLRYLVEHAQRLVTRDELQAAVWPGAAVNDGLLRGYIRELREILGDDPAVPRFIETVSSRGYRFVARVLHGLPRDLDAKSEVEASGGSARSPEPEFVGREPELAELHSWLDQALAGRRQTVFITGEPGIGKTALVETFFRQAAEKDIWTGRGQCIDHYATGEPFLPVLKALGRLCRGRDGERLVRLLGRHAPAWLIQMPTLIDDAELEVLQRRVQGATRERMLRELADAVEALTADRPLVLALEDLQWSDYSTLDLLSLLAKRRERARLLLIGTYRPADVIVKGHPVKSVKQELQAQRQGQELPLRFLTEGAVAEYLALRFRNHRFPGDLQRVIHKSSDGNPLFIVNLVDDLVNQQLVGEVNGRWELEATVADVAARRPENLRQLIEKQIQRLSVGEQRILEAASVAGAEFSTPTVAAALATDVTSVEEHCEGLARRQQFLRLVGSEQWPDGTLVSRYGFAHALYQHVGLERITPSRRQRWHGRIGEHLEAALGERAPEIAAKLAAHFEEARDTRRAVRYLGLAGKSAVRRFAYPEAVIHLTRALELVALLPPAPERDREELLLRTTLGRALMISKGWAAPEIEQAYARARELSEHAGETTRIFSVLSGLHAFHHLRAEFPAAVELGSQLLSLGKRTQDPYVLVWAETALGMDRLAIGDLTTARRHLEQGMALSNTQKWPGEALRTLQDPRVVCLSSSAVALFLFGYPDQALKRSYESLALAQELSHPLNWAVALQFSTFIHLLRREGKATQERAEAMLALCREQGFTVFLAWGALQQGWALAHQGKALEGSRQMREGLAALQASGTEQARPQWLTLLAEVCGKAGQPEEGLFLLAEALSLVNKTGERLYEAETHRLKGTLELQSKTSIKRRKSAKPGALEAAELEAELCFHEAIDIARGARAKALELRAVTSLARLLHAQGRSKEIRPMLADTCGWFTEGLGTEDLRDARALLGQLKA